MNFKEAVLAEMAQLKLLKEDEIEVLYREDSYKVIKSGNKYSAVFVTVPRDKAGANINFPYFNGRDKEAANIEKVTILPNEVVELEYTNGKKIKVTAVAIEKNGNAVLNRCFSKTLEIKKRRESK